MGVFAANGEHSPTTVLPKGRSWAQTYAAVVEAPTTPAPTTAPTSTTIPIVTATTSEVMKYTAVGQTAIIIAIAIAVIVLLRKRV